MGRLHKRHQLLIVWTYRSGLVLLVVVALAVATRRSGDATVAPGEQVEGLTSVLTRDPVGTASPLRFVDVTEKARLSFHHFPAQRSSLLPEDMGSGVACGDYDDDGFADLFFVNFSGSMVPGSTIDPVRGKSRLFRNVDGTHFEDVTDRARVGYVGFGMGASWGDFDSDGDLDLYITAYGPSVLYENRGDGTFLDVTTSAGVQGSRFAAGSAWADYDRDGDLDLYVCRYVDFVYRDQDQHAVKEQYSTEQPYTLNPSSYAPLTNMLYQNQGNGTFVEVAESVGVADPHGRSLSATWVDLDDDGLLDLYVANDVSNNGVFRNRGDGTFEDIGPSSLAADYRGAMGIAVADFDDDLDLDLLVTHWIAQENALFRNMRFDVVAGASDNGRVWFMDTADTCGLGQVSLDMVGWATGFADFDNDGRRDLWLVNGSTLEQTADHHQLVPQPPTLFWHRAPDDMINVAASALGKSAKPIVGRGGAHLDFDHDGLIDLVMLVHGGQAKVLRNTSLTTGHWLRVELRQPTGNTMALGAKIYATADGRTQMAQVGTGSSYLSQNESTVHFGLGNATVVDRLRIIWPDGQEEEHLQVSTNQTLRLNRHPN